MTLRSLLTFVVSCGLLIASGELRAQQAHITGYSDAAAAAELTREQRAIERIAPAALDSISFALSKEVHVAGSPAQARTRDYVLDKARQFGLRAEAKAYKVYMPWPTLAELELTAPVRKTFELREPTLSQDPTSALQQYPWVNGYSGQGEGQAEVVYANYGLYEDYAALDSIGVSVKGKIVLARYGNSYRGIKARLAEMHGAIGLLIYSDPADDGYVRGDVYPEGPFRPSTSVQRGSVMNGDGDPTTPGWGSVEGARRVEPGSEGGFELPHIPVLPISYGIAESIITNLRGKPLPVQSWQGGLAARYHVGPGPAVVRVKVADDRATAAMKDIWNTIAWLPGTDRADEWVIIGGHRDAWGAGALDNVSGNVEILGAEKALAEMAKAGERPRRTIIFASWDAEEWGLLGSTEWVEEMARDLGAKAVVYINLDGGASGNRFGSSGSPSLKQFVRDVAKVVPDPEGGMIYDKWRKQTALEGGADVSLGNLGGGSDFAGFYNHLGIPSIGGFGFGGGGGSYHSAYDTYHNVSTFADPGFVHHTATSKFAAVALTRLANAEVLPYDYAEFAREMRGLADRLADNARKKNLGDISLGTVDASLQRLGAAAAEFAAARDAALAEAASAKRTAKLNQANQHLMLVERTLTRETGLPQQPWMRNLMFAADYKNGYATLGLPGIAEGIRDGEAQRAKTEALDVSARVDAATQHLQAATAALKS